MTPLNDICHQDTARTIILNSFNRDRLASTYLFFGIDGVGKWAAAIALAALTNCQEPQKDDSGRITDACGRCRNCRQIIRLNFPEMHFALPLPPHRSESDADKLTQEYLEQKKDEPYAIITSPRQLTIPVNTARAIRRKAAIKPPAGTKRIIVFYRMENMLPASADSLLKLIEEPPPETIIILTAESPNHLLPTIQSRSQKIRFKPLPTDIIARYLVDHYRTPEKKAEFYARLAGGSLGQALLSLDEDDRSSQRQTAFLMFKSLFGDDTPAAVASLNELLNPRDRGGTEQILKYWQSFLSDLIIIKYAGEPTDIINTDLLAEMEKLAGRITGSDSFMELQNEIKKVILLLKRNVHIRPAMTSMALNFRRHLGQSS